jgi:hypothetical protein
MNRQLVRLVLVALLVSISVSFTAYPGLASIPKEEQSKRSVFPISLVG